MRRTGFMLAASLLALSACGGDSSGSGSNPPPPTATPTPSPAPAPAPAPAPTPAPTPTPGTSPQTAAELYDTAPDVAACNAGSLKPSVIQGVLDTFNEIRALHGLGPVALSPADSQGAQEAALMMVANNALSHSPPTSWDCYTQAGRDAAAAGNLAASSGGFFTNERVLTGWIDDVNNVVADNVGHRRWMLDPFLTTTAYGRVTTGSGSSFRSAAALKVFNLAQTGPTPTNLPDFVAYPFGNYPDRYFDDRALFSFSVIANKQSKFGANAQVDFSNARITMTDVAAGTGVAISGVSFDNQGFGLPNNLQFKPASVQNGRQYRIDISNVIANGSAQSYSYTFTIVP